MTPLLPLLFTFAVSQPVPAYVDEVLDRWEGTGIEVHVLARDCGFDNAWYFVESQNIVLCTDLFDRPELTRFIINHELSHAFMLQYGIPMVDAEMAADELAFFMSTEDEVYAAARWFMVMNGPASSDGHPADLDRAGALLCLQSVNEPDPTRSCRLYYRTALAHWLRWFADRLK